MLRGVEAMALSQPSQRITAVYSYASNGARVDYVEGQDWQARSGGVARMSNSRIPDFSTYQYVRSNGERFAFAADPRNPPLTIGFNVYFDYVSPQKDPMITARPLARPTGSVLCLGDSIASGAHTVANFYRGDDTQSWCGLLRAFVGPAVAVRNEAVPGATLQGVYDNLDAMSSIPGDTVIIAMGMNDHVLEPQGGVERFQQQLSDVVARFRSKGANVILVGFFQQNPLWDAEDSQKTVSYNEAIRAVASGSGLPFVDMREVFDAARPSGEPSFLHLTADFMHHPNIYGQRLYFSQLVPFFLAQDTAASRVPQYVVGPWTTN